MSLYLIELKIKTALELVEHIWTLNNLPNPPRVSDECRRLRDLLREIINRPKEEGNDG